MTALLVPQLSISMEEATVSRWLVGDGDAVAAGQIVVEVETDKATVEIEAPEAGLLRIVAAEGAVVAVDGVLAEVESGDGAVVSRPAVAAETPAAERSAAAAAPVAGATGPRRTGPIASPAARRLARDQGVELSAVQGTGPGGRIVARDVVAAPQAAPANAHGAADRRRAAVVANMAASWQQITPMYFQQVVSVSG